MKKLLVMGTLVMGMLVMGMAAPADARWYSEWSFDCRFKGNEVDLVSLAVWDDSLKSQDHARRYPNLRRRPTWIFVVTKEELAEMNVTVLGKRRSGFLGLERTCEVVSDKTDRKLSFDEAWVVFGDILANQEAAAKASEMARRNAIRRAIVGQP